MDERREVTARSFLCCLAVSFSVAALMAQEAPPASAVLPSPIRQAGSLMEASNYAAAAAVLSEYLPKANGRDEGAARLALAAALLEDDDAKGALEALASPLAGERSPFMPYVRYLRARALGVAGKPAEALTELKPLVAGRSSGSLRKASLRLFAKLAAQSGDYRSSARAWGQLEEVAASDASKASCAFLKAQSLLGAGEKAQAFGILKELYLKDISSPYGHQAAILLARDFPKASIIPASAQAALALARSFVVHGRALDGWDLLQSLGAKKLSAKESEEAALLRANALYALRWNDDLFREADAAREAFGAKSPSWDIALRALWACLRVDDANRARSLGQWLLQTLPPDDSKRGDALYALGSYAFVHGDFASAREDISLVLKQPATEATKTAALYKLAWAELKLGDAPGGIDLLGRVAASAPPSYAAPAKFMAASTLQKLGRSDAAAQKWAELSAARGYWAVAAREALKSIGRAAPEVAISIPPGSAKEQPQDPASYLAAALRAAGMGIFSAEAYEPYFKKHSNDPSARLAYATYLTLGESPNRGEAMALSWFGDVEGADTVDDAVARAVYPMPWRSAVNKGPAPAALVYAITRRESGFDSESLSPVGALGLMQLMPETVAKLALPGETLPAMEDILDPRTNISLGSLYLAKLNARFPMMAAAVAAYNAGEDRVDLWLKSFSPENEREFVAMIPYEETRLYTERVLLDYRRYQQLLAPQARPADK
ncbi:MAG: transglycosylase SLT domain-containing protein [Acidobacteria bacterium]|nr:transglycosylase SLT domain-containing protein [Acidobacteriota bacterium]